MANDDQMIDDEIIDPAALEGRTFERVTEVIRDGEHAYAIQVRLDGGQWIAITAYDSCDGAALAIDAIEVMTVERCGSCGARHEDLHVYPAEYPGDTIDTFCPDGGGLASSAEAKTRPATSPALRP